jgi:hypothetical protein
MVSSNSLDPVSASRVYAFLSIAQNDAIAETEETEHRQWDKSPAAREALIRAAVTSSSIAVLSELFSLNTDQFEEMYDAFAKTVDLTKVPKDTTKQGVALGQAVAEGVLRRARGDGSDRNSEVVVPEGLGHWRTEPDRHPLRPYWGRFAPYSSNLPIALLQNRHRLWIHPAFVRL